MVIALSFLGAAVVIGVLAYLAGCCLPEQYEAEVLAYIHKPLEEVWDAVMDHEAHPLTGPLAREVVTSSEDGLPEWTEQLRKAQVTVTTTKMESPVSLARHMRQDGSGRQAFIRYQLQPANQGCRITITNRTEISRRGFWSPIFRLMQSLEGVSSAIRAYVERVADSLGEPARFE